MLTIITGRFPQQLYTKLKYQIPKGCCNPDWNMNLQEEDSLDSNVKVQCQDLLTCLFQNICILLIKEYSIQFAGMYKSVYAK